jgi:hypothetical protein
MTNDDQYPYSDDDTVLRYYILNKRTEKEEHYYYDSWETVTELVPELAVSYTRKNAWLLQKAFDRKGMNLVLVEIRDPEEIDREALIAEQLKIEEERMAKAEAFRKAALERVTKRAKETEEKAKERKLKKLAKLKAELGVS